MTNNGYIKLHRRLLNWGWYKDQNTMAVFLHLLLTANFAESEYMGEKILPGQVVIGRKSLAETLGMSEQNVRTALNHLKSTNEITIKSTNRFSIVTIVKWRFYQTNDGKPTNEPTNNLTNDQPATNHTIRNQESKNIYGGRRPRSKKQELEESYAMMEEWANDEN